MKSSHAKTLSLVLLAGFLASAEAFAVDIPLSNWTVPPYQRSSAAGGITTMVDVTPGIGFVGVTPCRLVDTRQAGFPATYGQPALTAGVPRNFDLNAQPNCTGIPAGVEAYSLNITVTNTQGAGFILIYPQGSAQPSVSTLNYVAGETIANAAIVPAGTGGGVTVVAGVSGTDLIIDINGYFTDEYNSGVSFVVSGNDPFTSIFGFSFPGVMGSFSNASTTLSYGLRGTSASTTAGGAGVAGIASGTTGRVYGVFGETNSTTADAAGVFGLAPSGLYGGPRNLASDVGVWGESKTGYAVVGQTNTGTAGLFYRRDTAGANLQSAWVATSIGGGYAFYSVLGGFGGSAPKHFVEPHPTDATKIIKYISLEGAEAGTYFRGRAKFQNGIATIDVPEDFRIVSAEEGLSVQVTPIGEMASVAVVRLGLDKIVVRGSRNVEFFYTVNGVRRAYPDQKPIVDAVNGGEFMPMSADYRLPEYAPDLKQRLIRNGTYNQDGTPNMEKARQLGWDRIWEENARSERPSIGRGENP